MKKTFWSALLAGVLAFGMSNAFAQGGLEKSGDLNTKQMGEAKAHAIAALEVAKGGDAAGVVEHAKASWKTCKETLSETAGSYFERAMEKLNEAISAGEKGDAAAAVAPLEEAIARMTEGQAAADY
jgi:hypothetical protein